MVATGSAASRLPPALRLRGPGRRAATLPGASALVFAVLALVLWSAALKLPGMGVFYWIDEGISVGVASHPLGAIPRLLRQDGSPPLYYVLLHVWMGLFGTSEPATHALSLVFGLSCVPAALWATGSVFGLRAGLIAAAIAATNPFLSAYSDETRMYSLVALLAIIATGAFLHAFVLGRRRFAALFALAITLLLYTHGWGLFLAAGAAAAGLPAIAWSDDRRSILKTGAAVAATVALCFGPWVPTVLFQARHTAAPWSLGPTWRAAIVVPEALLGRPSAALPVIAAALAGLTVAARADRRSPRARALAAATAMAAVTMVCAYAASKLSGAWAVRYFATFLGPLTVVFGAALAQARWLGAVALVVVLLQWGIPHTPRRDAKSDARPVAVRLAPHLRPGDLVLSTHPEEVPVLHHYLPAGLRYATTLGPVPDPTIMDWRDALTRLHRATPARTLAPLLDSVPVGRRLALLVPRTNRRDWASPWLRAVAATSRRWNRLVHADRRFRLLATILHRSARRPSAPRLRALLFVRVAKA